MESFWFRPGTILGHYFMMTFDPNGLLFLKLLIYLHARQYLIRAHVNRILRQAVSFHKETSSLTFLPWFCLLIRRKGHRLLRKISRDGS